MIDQSFNVLEKTYEFLNKKFFMNDGVYILTKSINKDKISDVTFTYNDQLGINKDGRLWIFKKDTDVLKQFKTILNNVNDFMFKEIKFS